MEFTVTDTMIIYAIYAIYAIVSGTIVFFALRYTVKVAKTIMFIYKNKKSYREQKKKFDDMKARGEFPEWVEIPIMGETMHVCRKTLYCPKLDGFVKKEYFDNIMAAKKDQEKFQDFMQQRIVEICEKFEITRERLDRMMSELNNIPNEYMRNKIEDAIGTAKGTVDDQLQ